VGRTRAPASCSSNGSCRRRGPGTLSALEVAGKVRVMGQPPRRGPGADARAGSAGRRRRLPGAWRRRHGVGRRPPAGR
jgi:hypothetical protein